MNLFVSTGIQKKTLRCGMSNALTRKVYIFEIVNL